jgi:hypothetical protein
MKLNFYDFTPIMDVEGNISDFKFMKRPLEMYVEFSWISF